MTAPSITKFLQLRCRNLIPRLRSKTVGIRMLLIKSAGYVPNLFLTDRLNQSLIPSCRVSVYISGARRLAIRKQISRLQNRKSLFVFPNRIIWTWLNANIH